MEKAEHKKRSFTEGPYPEAHTIAGEKVPPDGSAQPTKVATGNQIEGYGPKIQKAQETAMPIGLSYPQGQDFGPYVQHCGEGFPSGFFKLDFKNDIPFSCGNVHPHTALMLYSLALNQRPMTIIETGTFYGYSTFFLARALEHWGDGGTVYTIDPVEKLISKEVKKHPNVEIITARSEHVLPDLVEKVGTVDFAFLDSYKRLALEEFLCVIDAIPPGGLVVFHDTQFLNSGLSLYKWCEANLKVEFWDTMLFCGTPHVDNAHRFFGNADDRGFYLLRRKEENPFLEVADYGSDQYKDMLLLSDRFVKEDKIDFTSDEETKEA